MKRLNFIKYDLCNSKENAVKNYRTKETFTMYILLSKNGLVWIKKIFDWKHK